MAALPDELWRQILEAGIKSSSFNYRDLCCLSIVCRRLRRIADEDSLWSHLTSSDSLLPPPSSSSSVKSSYKVRFEIEREKNRLTHQRAIWMKEGEVADRSRKIRELESRNSAERERMRLSAIEMSNLHKFRQASVALNVWQPEVVRGRQKQLVEQCAVPVESRMHGLEMELKLCKQLLSGLDKSHSEEKRRLKTAKEDLASLKYHPLQDHKIRSGQENESKVKRKKFKRRPNCKASNSFFQIFSNNVFLLGKNKRIGK
ncbi:F-box protein SKIP24-like [Rutidosis leptorrhynchoides]|uniref:F-box protein SKIP24-like n=1 Tax=Rutidosis leptorrhynchoides TaxID=125765 RepID=UPI003A99E0CE